MQRFIISPADLSTIGLFAAGHIDREEAKRRLILAGWADDADEALDCVDFVGLVLEGAATT